MLVLAPAACCLAGVALHQLLLTLARSVNAAPARGPAEAPSPARDAAPRKPSKLGKVRRLTLGSALYSPRACVRGGVRVALCRLLATHRPVHPLPDAPLLASHTSIAAGSTQGCPPWRLRPFVSPSSGSQNHACSRCSWGRRMLRCDQSPVGHAAGGGARGG